MAILHLRCEDGDIPQRVDVHVPGRGQLTVRANRPVRFDLPAGAPFAMFYPPHGYWPLLVDAHALNHSVVRLVFPAMPATGPLGWWHAFHGIAGPAARGAGVRIGIIDEALEIQPPGSCISHITNDGGVAWGAATATGRAVTPLCDHGEAVCALLGSRAATASGFAGTAPDADIFFAAAGADSRPVVTPQRLTACIDHLSEGRQCDIISASVGDYPAPLPSVERAVEDAADHGTVCIFAAGNCRTAMYPAKYPNCLTVAALGKDGEAPAGSCIAGLDALEAEPIDQTGIYLWKRSARGPEVDFCAPGVGVIWSRGGVAATASFGTSFACPVLAGVAAVVLSRDPLYMQSPRNRNRYDRALSLLRAASVPFGPSGGQGLWNYGRVYV